MNNPLRIVLAVLIGLLVGYSFSVAPGVYQQIMDRRAILQEMATNPLYQVIADIEAANPNLTVLNIFNVEQRRYDVLELWAIHAPVDIPPEESAAYFAETMNILYQNLLDYKSAKHEYIIVFATYRSVQTVEGPKHQVVALFSYRMSADAIRSFLANPTPEQLDGMVERGTFRFAYHGYQPIALSEILPREPGFIWPWPDECETCN